MNMNMKMKNGVLTQLPLSKRFELLGQVMALCTRSSFHRRYSVREIEELFIPPLDLNQFRIYRRKNTPVAIVTWALFSDELEDVYLNEKRALVYEDWNTGENIVFMDLIAPFGDAREIFKDLRESVFPGKKGKAVRIHPRTGTRSVMSLRGGGYS